jgi:hypothetical protein
MDAAGIFNAVQSHAMAAGLFERVNTAEPKGAPGNGLSCAIWVDEIGPVPRGSGLTATTARVVLQVRVFTNMLQEPPDAIDPNVVAAVDALMTAYSGDFELGGEARNVDLLGQAGTPLSARAGYVTLDQTMFRVVTIQLPVIVNDAWTQAP